MNDLIAYMQPQYVEWMDIWFSLQDQRWPAVSRLEAIVRSELRAELDRRGYSEYAHDRAVRVVSEIDRIYRELGAEQGKRGTEALSGARQMVEQQKAAIGQGEKGERASKVV